ncbi:MAG: glycoside hydrolase [Chloroflexota bacterium]
MKEVFVILAFHAHEPLWELPQVLLETIEDIDLKRTLGNENWVVRRSIEGRDIYLSLIQFARSLGVPVSLEATNELLVQLAKVMPETYMELSKAYKNGTIYPLYGHAHHTHIALLSDTEVEDEIRLNREYLHEIMGAPRPRFAGLFPIEDSLDASKLQGIKNSGIDFVIFPTLDRAKTRYRAGADADVKYSPFIIGQDIIALPRHFPVSQYIWRPITKWKASGLINQGYILGRYWVLPEEYRRRHSVRFPIDRDAAVEEYYSVLKKSVEGAPDGGLLLYIQDLELMDFGDVALDIMESAWKRVLTDAREKIRFVTPDEYLAEQVKPNMNKLGHVRFHQVSWAPEIRLVLRYDGHYPPMGAGKFRGIDSVRSIFRKWPFIFWEPGRYMVKIIDFLLDSFSIERRLSIDARKLQEIDYRFEELSLEDRIVLHSRIIRRACNWGWFPNEGLQKRPFLHAYAICDLLIKRLEELPGSSRKIAGPSVSCYRGLERLLEVILDTRYGFLSQAIVELDMCGEISQKDSFRELSRAMEWREEARRAAVRSLIYGRALSETSTINEWLDSLRGLLPAFRDYCRAGFVSLDHLQRVWMRSGKTEFVLQRMYDYLFELYPPLFPGILESTLTEEELKLMERPLLR